MAERHSPEAGEGRRLDEEVLELVLPEAGRVGRLQLLVRRLNQDAGTDGILHPALLQEEKEKKKVKDEEKKKEEDKEERRK